MQNNTFSGESLSQKLIVLDEIGSTNDYLKSKLSNFKPLPEWTAIMAKNQTMGRGQRQNSWKSEPNSNITFSFVIYPNHLSLQQHFTLNMLVSLGIIDWLKSLQIDSTIKWPNDIMIGNRKISGILIENISNSKEIRQSIIGIGLNVNQKQFSEEFSNRASSILNETGIFTEDLESECLNLLTFIAKRVESHKKNILTDKDLLTEYNNNLFRRDIPASYSSGNISFEATLVKVDGNGQLYLRTKEEVKTYYFKEVVFQMQ